MTSLADIRAIVDEADVRLQVLAAREFDAGVVGPAETVGQFGRHGGTDVEYVADLRAGSAHRGNDIETRTLVDELSEASAEFRDIWGHQEVAVRRSTRKGLIHPEVGALGLLCDLVVSPPTGQRLVLFCSYPGSGTAERLEILGVLGTQTFAGPS